MPRVAQARHIRSVPGAAAAGAGAMGEVYLAHDSRLRRDVAIKVLKADAAHGMPADRILREARLAATLRHPNICTIFEAGEIDGRPFIAMEYVGGRSLERILEGGRLPIDRAIRIAAQIADGLASAHGQGIVHRDLKLANILIDEQGRATILDFGIAMRVAADAQVATATRPLEDASVVAGTIPYMAPEVLRGQAADARSDIWSLGVVLFEMVAGVRPFSSTQPYELASSIILGSLPDMPATVPPPVQTIIRRCLAKEPGERYQRAAEARAAFEAAATPGTEGGVLPHQSKGRLRPVLVVAGAVTLAAVVMVAVMRWKPFTSAPARPPIRSIAVLPLANLSGDAAQDFFADGMTEALITDLARFKGLDVISRTSVMQFKTAPKPVPEVARALGVDVVVEGSVIRSGDRVRITAQLIDGTSDRHLWANDYDRDVRDILSLQRDVARAIAAEIHTTISPQESATAARRIDPIAHEKYLKGRRLILRFNEESIAEAIELLQDAVRIEPEFADAWAALASAHSERGIWGRVASRETGARAREAITRAVALDPTSSDGWSQFDTPLDRVF